MPIDLSKFDEPLEHQKLNLAAYDESPTQAPVPDVSRTESFLRGAGQGATLGFQDEASAWLERKFADLLGDQATKDLYKTKSYNDLLQTYRDQNKAAKDAHGGFYATGQIAGMAPGMIATGSLGGLPTQVGINALTSAANTVGEAENMSGEDMAFEALKSAALGGGLTAGLGGLARLRGVGKGLQGRAEELAVTSLGPTKKQIGKLMEKDDISKLGRYLLDEGHVGAFKSREGIAESIGGALDESGSKIGEIVQQADRINAEKMLGKQHGVYDEALHYRPASKTVTAEQIERMGGLGAGTEAPIATTFHSATDVIPVEKFKYRPASPTAIDARQFTNEIKSNIVDPLRSRVVPHNAANEIEGLMNRLEAQHPIGSELSFGESQQMLKDLRDAKGVFTRAGDTPVARGYEQVYGSLRDKQMGALENIGKSGLGDLATPFAENRNTYKMASQAEDVLSGKLAREKANRFLSPSDYISGHLGTQFGNDAASKFVGGTTGAVVNHALRQYGTQTAASTFDKVGSILAKTPEKFGKYARVLQNAAAKGPQQVGITHYVLSQTDPEYRQTLDQNINEGE